MKQLFSFAVSLSILFSLNATLAFKPPTNEAFESTITSKDGSNVEIYFHGYSHPNCTNAEYRGEVFGERYSGIQVRIKSFGFLLVIMKLF